MKKIFAIVFFYVCYGLRTFIISPIVNFCLLWLFLIPGKRKLLDDIKSSLQSVTSIRQIQSIVDDFYKRIFKYRWYAMFFTLYPPIFVMVGRGDCLTFAYFIKWLHKDKIKNSDYPENKKKNTRCLKYRPYMFELHIYELLSNKPFIRKNHAIFALSGDFETSISKQKYLFYNYNKLEMININRIGTDLDKTGKEGLKASYLEVEDGKLILETYKMEDIIQYFEDEYKCKYFKNLFPII